MSNDARHRRPGTLMRRAKAPAAAAAVMVTMAATACGSGTTTDDSGDVRGQSLTMVTYGGDAVDPMAAAYAAPFEQVSGAKVVQDSPTDYSKLQAMVKARNVTWNVINGDPYMTAANCGTLFEPLQGIDRSGIDPRFITDDCSVPADAYSVVLMYDKSKFGANPPTSWADFFDTAKFPGKRGLWNSLSGNALEIALLADGVAPKDLYPLDTDRAYRKLSSIKNDTTFYNSLAQSTEMLLNGQVSLIAALNTRGYVAQEANANRVGVSWNQALISWEAWTVPKGAPHLKASMELLGEVAKPVNQAKLASTYPVGPTVRSVDLSAVPPALLNWIPTSPQHLGTGIVVDQKYYADNYDKLNTTFTDFQSS
jgi:putative spermidine/putrescine transport system substrate-binding protein